MWAPGGRGRSSSPGHRSTAPAPGGTVTEIATRSPWRSHATSAALSTVTQHGERVGKAAISLLMERISGERTTARHYQIQPELRVRNSSQPVARGRTTP